VSDLLESVPNFSVGRDQAVLDALGEAFGAAGVRVLDVHADADHNRSVFTLVGDSEELEEALVAGVAVARDRIDLRRQDGAHPRIGAADVIPIVPIDPEDMLRARAVAAIVGAFLAGLALSESADGRVRDLTRGVSELLVPFFLVGIGSRMDLGLFRSKSTVLLAILILGMVIVTKVVGCGLGAFSVGWRNALKVGLGMVPRGEVGVEPNEPNGSVFWLRLQRASESDVGRGRRRPSASVPASA